MLNIPMVKNPAEAGSFWYIGVDPLKSARLCVEDGIFWKLKGGLTLCPGRNILWYAPPV